MEWLAQSLLPLTHWSWWIVALLLIVLEVAAPGVLFLWLGVAAGVVGLVLLAMPGLDWKLQFGLFAVLSIVSVGLSRRYLKRNPLATDRPNLNRRAEGYIGRELRLDEPIENGRGVARIDDTRWRVAGPDMPAGTRVRITGAEGSVLLVEPSAQSRP